MMHFDENVPRDMLKVFKMEENISFPFSFDQWVSQLCQILREQKIDSVAAILGLQEEDYQELFQGLPRGHRTSFRYARDSLAAIVSPKQHSDSQQVRTAMVAATPPDPEIAKPTSSTALKPKTLEKPIKNPRKSLAPTTSVGTVANVYNEHVTNDKLSTFPKDGGYVKKIVVQLEQFYKQQKNLTEDNTTDRPTEEHNKIPKRSSCNELLLKKSVPPPIPKRPQKSLLLPFTSPRITNLTGTLQNAIPAIGDLADNVSCSDDSTSECKYRTHQSDVEEEEYYDVSPMMSPVASKSIMDFKIYDHPKSSSFNELLLKKSVPPPIPKRPQEILLQKIIPRITNLTGTLQNAIPEEDYQELFQGVSRRYSTIFSYARNSLASKHHHSGSQQVRTAMVAATLPDPEIAKRTFSALQPKILEKPIIKLRGLLAPTASVETVANVYNEDVTNDKPSTFPKDGGNVKKIQQKLQLEQLFKQQKNPLEDNTTDRPTDEHNKILKSSSYNELLLKKSVPPPIPKRPQEILLQKIIPRITNLTGTLQNAIPATGDLADNVSCSDDSTAEGEYRLQSDVEEEEYYDVPPMMSHVAAQSIRDLKPTLESGFILKHRSRLSMDTTQLYQQYEDQEVTVKRNRVFESIDRRSNVQQRTVVSMKDKKITLWSELNEVVGNFVLESMSEQEINCKEALFEIISSQTYFVRSLTIVTTFFVQCPMLSGQPHLGSCIDMQERKQLFSNITEIKDINDELLQELESHLSDDCMLPNVVDIVGNHLRKYSKSYVQYCGSQTYQERMLTHLKSSNSEFQKVMSILERSKHCENLDLWSFLLSPMQRVTRYPLLLQAVLKSIDEDSDDFLSVQKTLSLSNQIATDCNEIVRKYERIEQLIELDKIFIYESSSPKRIALTNSDRWLLKQNLVSEIQFLNGRIQNKNLHVYLFTDMLLISKPSKNGKQFTVLDYCMRPFVEMVPMHETEPTNWPPGYQSNPSDKVIMCVFMKNSDQKRKKYFLKFETETDKIRWLSWYMPLSNVEDSEKIYCRYDCPQAEVISEYKANQEDELELKYGDVVNILQKMNDGWYQGERLRDHAVGWFPSSHVKRINNYHEEAKTIRERQRLIKETRQLLNNMNFDNRLQSDVEEEEYYDVPPYFIKYSFILYTI